MKNNKALIAHLSMFGACAFWGLGVTATEAHEPESEHSTHCTWCLEPTPCNQRGVPALCNYRRPVSSKEDTAQPK